MWLSGTFRILGILLMLFSLSMVPPILISLYYAEDQHNSFLIALAALLIVGFIAWLTNTRQSRPLRPRDGFFITVLIYIVLAIAGALPLYLSGYMPSWTSAVFESLSGLTTTGASVLSGLDEMPRSLLFYRQQLQWLGGMGIIMLAVALLPMLGVGGVQLYRAEIPTPDKKSRLKPRIAQTARSLWFIYLMLTIACMLAYAFAGMSWFDAICHSFSTVAIGGFSTHDASMAWFDNQVIESIAIFFMIVCSVNFGLHFISWDTRSFKHYIQDSELKFFLLLLSFGVLVTLVAVHLQIDSPWDEAWRQTLFQTVSIITTSGFTILSLDRWPDFVPVLIFMMAIIGGCAGSSAGGIKCVRMLVILRQSLREIARLIHPNAVYHVKIGRYVVPERTIHSAWGLFTALVFIMAIMTLIIMSQGFDMLTAFSAVIAAITNLGPGLGSFAGNYGEANNVVMWVLCLAMLLGRLEIYAVLVLLSPSFWR